MNVQELIDKLILIEDKTLPVCLVDITGGYMPPEELDDVNIKSGNYSSAGAYKFKEGTFVCLGDM